MAKQLISIISPAFNEEGNIRRCYEEVRAAMEPLLDRYDYEHIFGDNCSTDGTLDILLEIAAKDRRVKVLTYSRNWGADKNSLTLLRHCSGAAVIPVLSDLQDPPAKIQRFLDLWEQGYEIVFGTYTNRSDSFLLRMLRSIYYWLVRKLADEALVENHSGFGIYDRKIVEELKKSDDFNPYLRGDIASLGFRQITEPYIREKRMAGVTSYNFGRYLDFAINAMVSYSLVPIRLATISGVLLSGLSLLMALAYVIIKLFNWSFQAPGATTVVVLVLFFSGIQLSFLGILGEYIGAIHAQVRRKPFVVIRRKINFEQD
ncbi:MAG: glycosyltransferase family 2 protein [Holophagaceae bacterium]|nr:glycosyltransferase family 2 protein [Holophagaceae bacterium]